MMRKIINVRNTNMRHCIKALLKAAVCAFSLMLVVPSALADYYYLKPGQSKTITTPSGLDTVFVSNPTSADYKIIGDNKLVIYGRAVGYSDITLYDGKANVLNKISIEVDPLLADVLTRIKSLYPTSKVRVSKVSGASAESTAVYILSGTVPSEEAMDAAYRMIGEATGAEGKDWSMTKSSGGGGDDGGGSGEIEFMSHKSYDNIINRLTLPQVNQVNVRLTVVEVSKEFKDSLGIEWTNITGESGGAGASTGTFALRAFKGLNRSNIHNIVKAVQNDSLARVLAQPNLTVLSGESASFLVGGEVPIAVRDTSNNSVSIEYKEYGVKLVIAAKVETNQKIKLFLSNELSSVDGSYGSDEYSVPQFKTRKTSSTIELADGDSFAIAGLLNEQDVESLSKIPFIGDIPILGALARNTNVTRNKTELMVFATINIVKPTTSSANIELPSFRKTSTNKLFFNVGVNKQVREDRLNKNTQLSHDSEVFLSRGGFAK
jgi:pilus assembly protein CpaC